MLDNFQGRTDRWNNLRGIGQSGDEVAGGVGFEWGLSGGGSGV